MSIEAIFVLSNSDVIFRDSNESSPTRGRQMSFNGSTFYDDARRKSSTARVMDRLNIEKADGGAGITIGKVRPHSIREMATLSNSKMEAFYMAELLTDISNADQFSSKTYK